MGPDLETTIARGQDAERLLRDEAFVRVMNDVSNYHLAALLACRPVPSEQETRNYHHTLLHTLQEINDMLTQQVSTGLQAQEHLEQWITEQELETQEPV